MQEDLITNFKLKYPKLIKRAKFSREGNFTYIKILSSKNDLEIWLGEEENYGFIVGINELHSHLDYCGIEKEKILMLEASFQIFDQIISGKRVAIFKKQNQEHWMNTSLENALQILEKDPHLYELRRFQ